MIWRLSNSTYIPTLLLLKWFNCVNFHYRFNIVAKKQIVKMIWTICNISYVIIRSLSLFPAGKYIRTRNSILIIGCIFQDCYVI